MTWACFPQRRVALRGVSETSVEGGVGKSQTARGWVQDCGGCDSHKVSGVLTVTAPPAPRRSTGAADRTQKACRVRGLGLRRLLLDLELVLFDLLGDQQTGAVEGSLQTTSRWLSAGSRVPHTSPAEPPWPNRDRAETCRCRARAALRLPPSPGPPTATMAPTMAPGPEPKGVVIFQTTKPAPAPRWSTARPCRGPCTYLWYQFTLISSV